MIKNLVYPRGGFALTLIALESSWYFTTRRMTNKTIKPCMFKQIRLALVRVRQNEDNGMVKKIEEIV